MMKNVLLPGAEDEFVSLAHTYAEGNTLVIFQLNNC